MCKSFEDFHKIEGFLKYPEVYNYTDPNIEEIITTFQQTIKIKQKDKKTKIAFCQTKMTQAQRNAEVESITKIEAYKKAEKHIFREINKKRVEMVDNGQFVAYDPYENKLVEMISDLKGDLLDIEMALKQTLDAAFNQFVAEINSINVDMAGTTSDIFVLLSGEFTQFGTKLNEELNKEREQFQIRYETDDAAAAAVLDDYKLESIEDGIDTVLDILTSDEKSSVDDIVGQFIEKIELEAQTKEQLITKGRNTEWGQIMQDISANQHSRGRKII